MQLFAKLNRENMAKFILVQLCLFCFLNAQAQGPGVFATLTALKDNQVTFSVNNSTGIDVKNNKDLVAYRGEHKIRFKFNHISGYTDGEHVYRAYGYQSLFKDHAYYKILYQEGVVLYSRRWVNYKGEPELAIYYSLTKDSKINRVKRKFYDKREKKGAFEVEIDVAALKRALGLPAHLNEENIFKPADEVVALP
jgi:hypothetical protein